MNKTKYSYEIMKKAVEECTSIRGVIQYFNLKETGGNYSYMSVLIKRHELDISHFTGQAWAKGHSRKTHQSIESLSKKREVDESVILTENSQCCVSKTRLRKIVTKYKDYSCESCSMPPVWMGEPLTLHLDHINGNNNDNRLENLRFLCPNCHQQTPTWGQGNARKRS